MDTTSSSSPGTFGPLAGLKAFELGQLIAGPFAVEIKRPARATRGVISPERLSVVEEIDLNAATMTIGADTLLETVQRAASGSRYLFPLDLGARGSGHIGGNVATNAGGNRVIRYSKTFYPGLGQ